MDIQLDRAPCGYFSMLENGVVQEVNQTLLDLLEYKRDELVGKHIESAMSATNKMFFHTYFYPYIQLYGHVNEMYFSLRTSSSQQFPVLLNGVRQEREGIVYIDCILIVVRKRIEHEKDILQTKSRLEELYQATNEANLRLEQIHREYEAKQQELTRMNEELEQLASTDPLTGLKNRRYFQKQLDLHIHAYQESGTPFSLLILDIDHFKKINDTYGHPVGDLILTHLAKLLQLNLEKDDAAARFGGEEFVIILPGTQEGQAVEAAEKIREAAESARWGDYRITISVGTAAVEDSDTGESLLHKADVALYASKTRGRNQVTGYSEV
ncbi:sensor domain-containing diguanylate cyclase [Paenibacillus sp. JX-17]|uniref:Sensor domain-containing diguanylate cyclase n=1 Tax=Paenibacillus lacisoli TaxID=3064525 RepID=A0ABT9CEW5_9BACL|nr:sensor domain-containing diguanylate cyclase [Paenibacillus sp. JX-17]MDO7907756.1 sensor domain-containing diguanylate cyclase [Paenibacillus sp. JX-17]